MWHWYIHTWILFSHEKEGYPSICNNMNGPWTHYAKQDKPDKDKYYMISTYMLNIKMSNMFFFLKKEEYKGDYQEVGAGGIRLMMFKDTNL